MGRLFPVDCPVALVIGSVLTPHQRSSDPSKCLDSPAPPPRVLDS